MVDENKVAFTEIDGEDEIAPLLSADQPFGCITLAPGYSYPLVTVGLLVLKKLDDVIGAYMEKVAKATKDEESHLNSRITWIL
jgi:hypothetical protein